MKKILLVEDDPSIILSLKAFLEQEGFDVDSVRGQNSALEILEKVKYDLVLIDILLEDGNGYAVCKAAKVNPEVAVIFLTASGDEFSVVAGLDMGADDYINKPFRPRELVSRINNALRHHGKKQTIFQIADLTIDIDKGIVQKKGKELYLSALEYRLMLVFANNKGTILTRTRLLEEIWDIAGEFVNDNTLTVYIKRLRDKIEQDPQNPVIIRTIRGMGYRLDDEISE